MFILINFYLTYKSTIIVNRNQTARHTRRQTIIPERGHDPVQIVFEIEKKTTENYFHTDRREVVVVRELGKSVCRGPPPFAGFILCASCKTDCPVCVRSRAYVNTTVK